MIVSCNAYQRSHASIFENQYVLANAARFPEGRHLEYRLYSNGQHACGHVE